MAKLTKTRESRLRALLRRQRAMLQRLSNNNERLYDLTESEVNEMIEIKQETNKELEK